MFVKADVLDFYTLAAMGGNSKFKKFRPILLSLYSTSSLIHIINLS